MNNWNLRTIEAFVIGIAPDLGVLLVLLNLKRDANELGMSVGGFFILFIVALALLAKLDKNKRKEQ